MSEKTMSLESQKTFLKRGVQIIIISNKPERQVKGAELIVAKNDTVLVEAVTRIRERNDYDTYVPGGVRTAQNFSRLGLIDEYILMVHPIRNWRRQASFHE